MSILSVPEARILHPGRTNPDRLVNHTYGNGSAISWKHASAGELAGMYMFGFVLESVLLNGRTYQTPQNQTRLIKELKIVMPSPDCERSLAMISMVLGGKVVTLATTEEGGITFSTKHTAVAEEGNPTQKSTPYYSFMMRKSPNLR